MGWFNLGRGEGYPSHYGDQHSPAHTDVLMAGLILAFLILAFSCFAILPAYSSQKRYLTILGYTTLSLFIGGIILVCNFGYGWEVGHAKITSPYKPASAEEVRGEIGLHVSLRGINITLTGELKTDHSSEISSSVIEDETIDYNENFSWEWVQGRFGFGYYAGRISRDFRAAVIRGVPIPILQLSEYFTFDGEGIRFGRHYRLAGYYSHFFLWTAFATWILTNIMFFMSVLSGAILLTVTGLLQLFAVLIWTFHRNVIELQVPYESSDGLGEVILKTSFGPDYYLILSNAIFCIILGIGICILNFWYADQLCEIFGIDPLSLYEEEYQTQEEVEKEEEEINQDAAAGPSIDSIELGPIPIPRATLRTNDDIKQVILRRKVRYTGSKSLYRQSSVLRSIVPPPQVIRSNRNTSTNC